MFQVDVQTITKFKLDSIEYDSLEAVRLAVEDKIGVEVIDPISRKIDIKHSDKFVLYDILTSPEIRQVLLKYLKIEYLDYSNVENIAIDDPEVKNILDLKLPKKK